MFSEHSQKMLSHVQTGIDREHMHLIESMNYIITHLLYQANINAKLMKLPRKSLIKWHLVNCHFESLSKLLSSMRQPRTAGLKSKTNSSWSKVSRLSDSPSFLVQGPWVRVRYFEHNKIVSKVLYTLRWQQFITDKKHSILFDLNYFLPLHEKIS